MRWRLRKIDRPIIPISTYSSNASCGTHKDQNCVQVVLTILQKFFVMFSGYLMVVLVEFGLIVPSGGPLDLFWAVRVVAICWANVR